MKYINGIKDYIKGVYKTFIKFAASSLSATVIDLAIFQVVLVLISDSTIVNQILIATIIARVASAYYNYEANRRFVFNKSGRQSQTLIKFTILTVVRMMFSALLVTELCKSMAAPELIIKMIVDLNIFILSYTIQKRWVFKDEPIEDIDNSDELLGINIKIEEH